MVDVARSRAESLELTNVEFRVMDAENMDLPTDTVDGAICRWGYMLMLDPAAALRETRRVLRPGGRLAFSVWAGPAENPWVTLMGMVLTQRGRPPQNDPFGPGGIFSLSDHGVVRELVAGAGFEHVEIENIPVMWSFENFETSWEFSTELAGAIAALVAELDPGEVEEIKKDVQAAAEAYRVGDGYEYPGLTVNVLAQ